MLQNNDHQKGWEAIASGFKLLREIGTSAVLDHPLYASSTFFNAEISQQSIALQENLLQLPSVDMQANPILLPLLLPS
jgi:hypothetical protein